jgi:(1->4)-alpha-D-glucan 1-alpha-D-glucosylmutase
MFCASFAQFQQRTALYGMLNGLGQVLLKVACPGVPDIYQGSELWDFHLVDPDNRDPVDYARRVPVFDALQRASNVDCARHAQDLLSSWCDSRVKLHVLARALAARRERPDLFLNGSYHPLASSGEHSERVFAFARQHNRDWAVAVVPRCAAAVNAPVIGPDRGKFWTNTDLALPNGAPTKWFNVFAGKRSPRILVAHQRLSLANAFDNFPIALLLPDLD